MINEDTTIKVEEIEQQKTGSAKGDPEVILNE